MAFVETSSGAALSAAQAITTTADSTNVFDVTGAGVGTLPAMIGTDGKSTAIGFDIGATSVSGAAVTAVLLSISGSTTTTGTLTVSVKVAPDSGTGTEGAYTLLTSGPALTGATQLGVGAQYVIPIPPLPAGVPFSRFLKLTYTVSASVSVVVNANLLINAPLPRDVTLFGSNFVSV